MNIHEEKDNKPYLVHTSGHCISMMTMMFGTDSERTKHFKQ